MARLRRLLDSVLDLPQDVFLDLPRITVIGCEEVSIENPRGVLHFSDTELVVELAHRVLRIAGENLSLRTIQTGGIVVTGKVIALVFEGAATHD
ncbi:MAG: hypothetical protein DDT37_00176 [Firmicutes bacterium]|nr:hypothetical protein [candidate division NPL-UPA2 bacterium]MBT9155211.1 hypothetical protein [candidate division NPL-UPA2 bacterium]